ncbi:MAG: hypothetical protein Q7V88_11155 [Actinomycetota bacterium]|nr:hypothetical protein [Actinomycetota bacterium]
MTASSITIPFDEALHFAAHDDQMHPHGPQADWTETMWFSFNVPERSLAGWLYVQTRPNIGTSAGGAFLYGPGDWAPWELPFYNYFDHQSMPDPLDLRDVQFMNGVSCKVLEPGMKYRLGYRFRDSDEFVADLLFEGLTPPVPHVHGAPPFTGSSHYDQHGHVTGDLWLKGERIPVDCVAVRDRSWGRRPELVGLGARRLSYVFGAVPHVDGQPDDAFLVFCQPPADDQEAEVETLSSGYLLRDGQLRRLASATRVNTRDAATGGIQSIVVDITDTDGRTAHIVGEARGRMMLAKNSLCINTFLRFDLDGREAFGEDQDVWPVMRFRNRRRAAR